MRAIRAMRRACASAWRALGHIPSALLCVAALATAVMYCSNDNLDAHPEAPRGDGQYRPVMARGDGHIHFLVTRSLVFDRDLNFDNDLARFGDPWRQPLTATGRKRVMHQLGPSLVWAPILTVAHGAALVANLFGADIPTHGYTMFHQRILFASSVLFAWLTLALGVLVAVRLVGGRWGPALAGIAGILGTSILYYATYMPSYAHSMDAAATAAFLAYWVLTLEDVRWRRFVILGILLGVAAMVRPQGVLLGVVVALEVIVLGLRRWPAVLPLLARGAVVLAIAIVVWSPQLYAWKQVFGTYFLTPQGPGYMRYGHPMVLELLFSSRNGWFSITPIAYLGVIGLGVGLAAGPRLGARVRFVCGALLIVVALQVYLNAVVFDWWASASFGQRRLCNTTVILVIGLAVLLRGAALLLRRIPPRGRRALAIAGLGYLVAWNIVWVNGLRHAKSAGRDDRPPCCGDVPAPLAWIARPIYARIGNPFALPASAVFAVRHGVGIRRWDVTVGNYALVPSVLGYIDNSYRRTTGGWNLTDGNGARYLLDGWGPTQRAAPRAWRWTTAPRAEALVPLLIPEPHVITIPIAANVPLGTTLPVTIRWNGDVVATADVGPAWTTIAFRTGTSVGEGVLAIEAAVTPFRGPASAGAPAGPPRWFAGVAVGPLKLSLP